MVKRFIHRLLFALLIYAGVVWVLSSVHDYPQFLDNLRKFRAGEQVIVRRPWLNVFYFINEAGSGIKFLLTGNERHMRHYPSFSHLFASRLARAARGDWRMQFAVGKMYFLGEGTEVNRQEGMYWLRLAHDSAPPERRAELSAILAGAEGLLTAEEDAAADGAAVEKNN